MIRRIILNEEYRLVPHCEPGSCVGCAFDDNDAGCLDAGWKCHEDDHIWIKTEDQ